ncbi:LysR family transcriptional regulator [Colwellia sp. 4_MG-2023]|uniref:LysR family transcriptional regulator n=1 Tax=unclassified Colwellia TaxID=196834 RepID=UPI001C08BB78|nr:MULTISPECIES: LysR family transcriptional regulator [unclassified Colwellia]MBU2926366.1 LysR family transcriptional regulator [Colwellia sp. C2M11]MDO6506529.1 LysR family transcriptional regulator [Colwellia sp. 5_MG-2023]MDO6555016.1 LysR family transcriptional regulator [Colwellia sp. 4_MG-2023]MDO6651804.1 LysR family transcriptional regulator [Colwellia sp. 3_MG-2023]MDO6665285.1 LysR family transcriptional regulator [Colwellia sp. 2_MG-2023]
MTLEQLRMLVKVAELGSLKEASEKLFKTQPAVSQGLKQLEAQLGLQLFNRQGYRLVLTDNGKQIYQHAQRLMNEAKQIKQLASFLAIGNEAAVTLAIEASYDLKRILPVLESIRHDFPHTQIILKQEYINGALEAVKSEQADLALTTIDLLALQSGDYEAKKLYQGGLCNVASPALLERHPALMSVEALKDEYQIVVQDSGQSSQGINYSVQTGQRCWYVNDFNTKKTLIMSGIGWGRLPEYMIENELKSKELIALKLSDVETYLALNYQVIKLKSRLLGPVASRLWQNMSLIKNN